MTAETAFSATGASLTAFAVREGQRSITLDGNAPPVSCGAGAGLKGLSADGVPMVRGSARMGWREGQSIPPDETIQEGCPVILLQHCQKILHSVTVSRATWTPSL